MKTEKESADHDEPSSNELEESVDTPKASESSRLEPITLDDLPAEPVLPWTLDDTDKQKQRYEPAKALSELLSFHWYGRRLSGGKASPPRREDIPATFHAYRELSRIRYDYPVCIAKDDQSVRSLTRIIDDLVAQRSGEDDEEQSLTRHIYQIESIIKSLAATGGEATLSTLWDKAAEKLLAASGLSRGSQTELKAELDGARRGLDFDGPLWQCESDVAQRLFLTVVNAQWHERCRTWRDRLDKLVRDLENILSADLAHSPEASSPERLKASTGTPGDDMDFEAMASILGESDLGEPIPDRRRERIRNALTIIRHMRPLFNADAAYSDTEEVLPFQLTPVVNDGPAALDRIHARMKTMVDFFRAVHIAELEIENDYRDDVHDVYFHDFGLHHLSGEELHLCPPVLLVVSTDYFANHDASVLLEIVSSGLPIKVLVQLDDVCAGDHAPGEPLFMPAWPSRLAGMALSLGHCYVMQATVSNPHLLAQGFKEAFCHDGPALLSAYTGRTGKQAHLSTYLDAAAALESRIFPAFTFDPTKGDSWAERMSVEENSQPQALWPLEPFSYRTAEGHEATVELAFSPADFLMCDPRFKSHYWSVPAKEWHENMVPLQEYLELTEDERTDKVPYVIAVDRHATLVRVVVTSDIVAAEHAHAAYWRHVQELGGINNSFAQRSVNAERERLEEEKRREIDDLKQQYELQLDRDIGGLTMEIIQRIARQLIAQDSGTSTLSPPPMTPTVPGEAPAEAPVAEPELVEEPAAAEEEEDEEAVSFDDPYIDTPLCTTCNECTNLNGKMFAYNNNKQAYIKDATAGTFRELVMAAESCPVKIIHPGKPKNPAEDGLEEWVKRAAKFN